MNLVFAVYGDIRGKGRPRATNNGGSIHVYTPAPTRRYEKLIRDVFMLRVENENLRDVFPIKKYALLHITAYCKLPTQIKGHRLSKKEREELLTQPAVCKPDGDNIQKVVADALNGVAWLDDMQVADWHCEKWYAPPGTTPWLSIRISDYGD